MTLNRAEILERISWARTPRKLPTILNADGVVRFLEAVPSLKARTALTDVDSDRMVIQARHSKGAKDRAVMLSPGPS